MRLAALLFAVALAGCAPTPSSPLLENDAQSADARVVVFVQPDAPVDARFLEEWLPSVRSEAALADLPVTVVDASRGAPEEVTVTPLIAMDTPRGRSLYQGRYTTLDRLRSFLRTARRVPQAPGGLVREDVGAWRYGRSSVAAPIKVAPVTGTRPAAHDDQAFDAEARRAIARGLNRFELVPALAQARADRAFYMDFYPWLSEDGTLYLSLALFSQFHCKKPVFATPPDAPLVAPWGQRAVLFEQGARMLEAEVVRQLALGDTGDAFTPVARSLPTVGWDDLGLPPHAVAERSAADVADAGPLPTSWTLERGDAPSLLFHLAAPLDGYAGEVQGVRADVTLGEGVDDDALGALGALGALTGASGVITATTRTVTMGEADLDEAVRGSAMLRVSRHPEATFAFDDVAADGPLAYGRLTQASTRGTFTLKGLEVPLDVVFQVEPVIADDGRPRLLADGSFSFRLRDPFDIIGLSEPMPAADTIEFDFAFRLAPAE